MCTYAVCDCCFSALIKNIKGLSVILGYNRYSLFRFATMLQLKVVVIMQLHEALHTCKTVCGRLMHSGVLHIQFLKVYDELAYCRQRLPNPQAAA